MNSITFKPGEFQDPTALDPYIVAIQETLEGPAGKIWIRFIEALIENQKEALVESNPKEDEIRGGIKLLRWMIEAAMFPVKARIAEREAREAQAQNFANAIGHFQQGQ